MKLFISRQVNWPDGTHMVEVAQGGLDYANPGMLVPQFKSLGEGQEYSDPREAVDAAIQIRDAWKRRLPDEEIEIGMGHTFGFTMPFDGDTDQHLRERAEKLYENLPKCAECCAILGKTKYGSVELGEYDCCSEYCAEKRYFTPDNSDEPDEVSGED